MVFNFNYIINFLCKITILFKFNKIRIEIFIMDLKIPKRYKNSLGHIIFYLSAQSTQMHSIRIKGL